MRQFTVTNGEFDYLEHVIEELERPPMMEIPEYREKFHVTREQTVEA